MRRKIDMISANHKRAVIYRDFDNNEYVIVFWRGKEKLVNSDYFTDNRSDAYGTAHHFVNFG